MSNNTRQSGWYRVYVKGLGKWVFAEYHQDIGRWTLNSYSGYFYDNHLEINETLLNPDPAQPIINNQNQ